MRLVCAVDLCDYMTISFDVGSLVQGVGIVVGGIFAIGIVVLLYRAARDFFARLRYEGFDRKEVRRRWKEIEALLSASGEVSRKLAVIEADKLLDYALKGASMPGATLGERLKFASYKYPWIRDVWWAHKVRNQLAHEASYHLDAGVARKAVREFEKVIRRLGAL